MGFLDRFFKREKGIRAMREIGSWKEFGCRMGVMEVRGQVGLSEMGVGSKHCANGLTDV